MCENFMLSAIEKASLKEADFDTSEMWQVHQRQVSNFRNIMCGMVETDSPSTVPRRLIIPIHYGDHFFVACFDFSVTDPLFFINIAFYDSFECAKSVFTESSTAFRIVQTVNLFFNT